MRSFILAFAATVGGLLLLIAVPVVHAQTMGEYGMQTAASAANAQSAGSAMGSAIRRDARLPAAGSPSGGSRTVTIPAGNDEGGSQSYARTDKSSNSSNSTAAPWKGNWVRVR